MFVATCPHCATRSILPETRVLDLERTETGFLVRYRCWCGAEATLVTPARRPRSPAARTRRGERREPLPPVSTTCR